MLLQDAVVFDPDRVASLAPAGRRVAEFLESGGPEALVLSAAAIAAEVGTSDATVIRTAQALGYPGLGELRRALANRQTELPLAQRLRQTLEDTPTDQLLARTISNHLAGLQILTERVEPELFERAVTVLAAGARVVWRGIGPSAALAQYAQLLCERIGQASISLTQMGTSFADELLRLQPTDVVVVLAYGRLQAHVLVLLDHAARLGSKVILITDMRPAKVADRVELVLESGRGIPGLFASHTATLVLIEALVLGLAADDEPAAEASLAELNDLRARLAGRRLDVDRP
jgi:DNA-binding MurR/RpiR family transcriptional regulator